MNKEQSLRLDEKTAYAVSELEGIITKNYPSATFAVTRGIDEPHSINVLATVDIDDPDEVLEKVLDRVVELHGEEGVPVHVVALRTPERIAAYRRTPRRKRISPLRRLLPFLKR
jgi:hypothetical protein